MYTNFYLFVNSFFIKVAKDRIYTYAATSAFFIILAIFPFLMVMLTIVQYTPLTEEFLLNRVGDLVPEAIYPLIAGIIGEIYKTASGATLIFISAIAAIWSASKGVMSMIRGVNVCFNVDDRRNYFLVRFLASLYTIVFAIALVILLVLMVFGMTIYNMIKGHIGTLFTVIEYILQNRFIITTILITLFFMLIYSLLPEKKNNFFMMFPGAVLAALGWTGLSALASLYVKYFPSFSVTYGSLTSFILFMLWLYFGMYIIFICAEINYFFKAWMESLAITRKRRRAEKYEAKMETKKLRMNKKTPDA